VLDATEEGDAGRVSSSASTVDTTDAPIDDVSFANFAQGVQEEADMEGGLIRSGTHRLQLERAVAMRRPQVLELDRVLQFPEEDARNQSLTTAGFPRKNLQLGSVDVPSLGSLGHNNRRCKPCAFVTRRGCVNGIHCKFCHLCGPGEKKLRRKEKRALLGAAKQLAEA
jgi:hypothetical protein